MSFRTAVVAVALSQLACTAASSTPPPEPRVIKTYDVPAGTGRDLRNAINSLTGAGNVKEGQEVEARAQVLPDGRVAVYGSERFHAGVAQLLSSVAAKPPPPMLSFRVWQVRGVPGTGVIPPTLEAIRPALEEVSKTVGPTDFTLVEPTLLNVASGELADAVSPLGRVEIEASMMGDAVFARLKIEARGRRLGTTLQLPQGKTVVIGQTSEDDGKGGIPATVFSVVQASVAHVAVRGQ
ncbi:MAG: hypothetical protein AB1938_06985 [Myxococcota bacterium]